MSWEAASVVVTIVVGAVPLLMARRRGRAVSKKPVEQSWSLSIRLGRRRR